MHAFESVFAIYVIACCVLCVFWCARDNGKLYPYDMIRCFVFGWLAVPLIVVVYLFNEILQKPIWEKKDD